MGTELAISADLVEATELDALTMEGVVASGDLSVLSAEQRLKWYAARCRAAGLDMRTQPFEYLSLGGKTVLYAKKTASDQLAMKNGLNIEITGHAATDGEGIISATCRVTFPGGRSVVDEGHLFVGSLKGEALANARMKVITKAKRRTILSACGMGMLDESEVDSVEDAYRLAPDANGELRRVDPPTGRPQLDPPRGRPEPPKPATATDEQVADYANFVRDFLAKYNAEWEAEWDAVTEAGGEAPAGDVMHSIQLNKHNLKWAISTNRLDAATAAGGEPIERYLGIVYADRKGGRNALRAETKEYWAFKAEEKRVKFRGPRAGAKVPDGDLIEAEVVNTPGDANEDDIPF